MRSAYSIIAIGFGLVGCSAGEWGRTIEPIATSLEEADKVRSCARVAVLQEELRPFIVDLTDEQLQRSLEIGKSQRAICTEDLDALSDELTIMLETLKSSEREPAT